MFATRLFCPPITHVLALLIYRYTGALRSHCCPRLISVLVTSSVGSPGPFGVPYADWRNGDIPTQVRRVWRELGNYGRVLLREHMLNEAAQVPTFLPTETYMQ